jgi:dihydrolipoamide dehydrogenase
MATRDVTVPDIGDFENVDVIEVLVGPGDEVREEDSLVTLESDKATMEIPSPYTGRVQEVRVGPGDKVSQGTAILTMDVSEEEQVRKSPETETTAAEPASGTEPSQRRATPAHRPEAAGGHTGPHTEVLVIGAGPGGYTAAFRAADLGKQVTLVERYPTLGGVCLNVGCIPSKALLHVAGVIGATETLRDHGVRFGSPKIDLDALRGWKDDVVRRLTDGLAQLAQRRKVNVIRGVARFSSDHAVTIESEGAEQQLEFEHAIIAAGSQAATLPGIPYEDPRIMDSTGALALEAIPRRLLVVGGGIIGLEMAAVYDALGARVTVVELTGALVPGCDPDLVRPLAKRIGQRYENIFLNTRVSRVEAQKSGLKVHFEGQRAPKAERFDRILVATGRRPNGHAINAESAGVRVDERGFIPVDAQQRTSVPHIHAIGDIVGEPQLAHKATHQGKVAAEVIAGERVAFDARAIPSVAYTDPEIAWMGLTEQQAKEQDVAVRKAVFPWAASGRALGMGRDDGFTKLLFDDDTGRLVGAGMVGLHAGDLIAEAVLALEMGADATDIGLSIHPHPTLSETIAFAAEIAEGTVTDLYVPRKG